MIFLIFLIFSCLKDKEQDVKPKSNIIDYGFSIEKEISIKLSKNIDSNLFLEIENNKINGIKDKENYLFPIENEGTYLVKVDSSKYNIKDNKILINKIRGKLYYKGSNTFDVEELLDEVSNSNNEIDVEEQLNNVENRSKVDLRNLEVELEKPIESSRQSKVIKLKAPEYEEEHYQLMNNSKFINNNSGDYLNMGAVTAEKKKLTGEILKDTLTTYGGYIKLGTKIARDYISSNEDKNKKGKKEEQKSIANIGLDFIDNITDVANIKEKDYLKETLEKGYDIYKK